MDDQAPRRQGIATGRKPTWRWVLALVLACCALLSTLILFFHLTGPGGSLTRVRPGVVLLAIVGIGAVLLVLLVVLGWLLVRAHQRVAPHLPAPARWLVAALGVVVEVAAAVLALVGLLLLFLQQDDMYSTRIDGPAYYVEAGYPGADGRHSVWRAKDLVRMTKVGYLEQGNSHVEGLDRDGVKQLLLIVNHGRLDREEIATFGGAALIGAAEGIDDIEAQAKAPSAKESQQAEPSPSADPSPSDEPPSMAERCAAGADCYESVWTRQPVELQVVQELVDALTLSGVDLFVVRPAENGLPRLASLFSGGKMTIPTCSTVVRPSVWVGCLACYNSGYLLGEWVHAEEAARTTPNGLHKGPTSHEELWCFDLEGFPTETGELSLFKAAQWGELYDEVGKSLWPAFLARVERGCYVAGSDDLPCVQLLKKLSMENGTVSVTMPHSSLKKPS